MIKKSLLLLALTIGLFSCTDTTVEVTAPVAQFDLMIVNGLVYDGHVGDPYHADIRVNGDRIAAI